MEAYGILTGWQSARLAVRSQVRVVGALIRREMVSHGGESRLGYLWALLGPVFYLGVMLLVFDLVLHRSAALGKSTALFCLTGVVPWHMYSKIAGYVSDAVANNRGLLTLPPVKLLDVIWARVILEAATFFLIAFMMFLVLYIVGIPDAVPFDLLTAIEACLIGIAFGLGVGLINIVISSYFHNWMIFFHVTYFPLWFLSGVWFLPEEVPSGPRDWMLYNPILHLITLFRLGFYPDYRGMYLDVPYLLVTTTATVALGMALLKVCQRRVLQPL
jgi:capsular polysaccharide transport system permease protein